MGIVLAVENDCMINIDSVFDAENVVKVAKEKPDKIVQVTNDDDNEKENAFAISRC